MKLLVAADDSGSIKQLSFARGTDTSRKRATQPDSITTVAEMGVKKRIIQFKTYKSKYVVAIRSSGIIDVYDLNSESLSLVKQYVGFHMPYNEKFVSLIVSEQTSKAYACTSVGQIFVLNLEDLDAKVEVLQLPGLGPLQSTDICCVAQNPERPELFAYGGKENNLMVAKLDGKELTLVFKAKNVSDDQLQLRIPVWITKVAFLSSEEGQYQVLVTTKHGRIQVYDSNKSRKPIVNKKPMDKPFMTLAVVDETQHLIIASDTTRDVAKFNYMTGKMVGKFAGSVGSTQAINVYKKTNMVVTASLDRYIRCYDITTRRCFGKVYVGTYMSDIIVLEDKKEPRKKKNSRKHSEKKKEEEETKNEEPEESESESDEEEMWHTLESNLVSARKKRRLELTK